MSLTDSTTKKDLPDTIEIIMDKLILIAGNVELVKSYLEGQDSFNESNPGLTPWNEGRLIWAVLDQIFKETSSAWNLLFLNPKCSSSGKGGSGNRKTRKVGFPCRKPGKEK